jgi:hypothetical protein
LDKILSDREASELFIQTEDGFTRDRSVRFLQAILAPMVCSQLTKARKYTGAGAIFVNEALG